MSDVRQRYERVLMNAFGTPRRVLVSGSGCYLRDEDGRSYLDLLAGLAVNSLGHAHPAIVETVTRQVGTLTHVSNFFATPNQVALAERLLEIAGCGDGRVFLTNSGSESVETALKLTRLTGRSRIVVADGGFHGRTTGALSLTAKPALSQPFLPLLPDIRVVPYGDSDALAGAVDDTTAAVLLEPIQGEAGVVVPPDGYLAAARAITAEHGALLWVDEVQTGIGRTGTWFAFQQAGIRPDLVTAAKGLGSGFPIGACLALGDRVPTFTPGQHGSTYGGNPLAAAVALTVLDVIERDDLMSRAVAAGAALRETLSARPGVRLVRGSGLLLAAVLDGDDAAAIADAALANGVIVNACRPDVIRLAPPLILGSAELDDASTRLSAAWQR